MRTPRRLFEICLALGLAARLAMGGDLRDLFFGEALYHAQQGQYFEAIQRLDTELAQYHRLDEPELDTLHYHVNEAEFSVGDFELDYRMHYRAGRAIKRVLEGSVDDAVRNEAAFRLARIHFQKDQLDDALQALVTEIRVVEGLKEHVVVRDALDALLLVELGDGGHVQLAVTDQVPVAVRSQASMLPPRSFASWAKARELSTRSRMRDFSFIRRR